MFVSDWYAGCLMHVLMMPSRGERTTLISHMNTSTNEYRSMACRCLSLSLFSSGFGCVKEKYTASRSQRRNKRQSAICSQVYEETFDVC